jgi:hypothetical protein
LSGAEQCEASARIARGGDQLAIIDALEERVKCRAARGASRTPATKLSRNVKRAVKYRD